MAPGVEASRGLERPLPPLLLSPPLPSPRPSLSVFPSLSSLLRLPEDGTDSDSDLSLGSVSPFAEEDDEEDDEDDDDEEEDEELE